MAHRFGQAALVHVLVAHAPLPASAGMVHGPRGAGHPVAVVAGVGGVVGPVAAAAAAVVVVVVAAKRGKRQRDRLHLAGVHGVFLAPSLAANGNLHQMLLHVFEALACKSFLCLKFRL